jgi:choline-sulfatase
MPRFRNILFLFSDEHHARILGCDGHPLVRTPNLDRLAARGTRFTRAYTPSPICVPARASLATGRWVHETRYWDNAIAYDGRVPGWAHRLRTEGVRVESIGKLHYRNAIDDTGFARQHVPTHLAEGLGQIWAAVRDPLPEPVGHIPLYDKLGAGESSYNRYDRQIADLGVRWLEERAREHPAQPWMLFAGFVAPHFPLIVPQRYLDLYPLDSIPDPKLLPRNGHVRHPWVERKARFTDFDAFIGSDERRKLAIASYLGLVTYLDEQLGRVLDALARLGLDDSTLIVYASDHGEHNGARGLWGKGDLYREATQVPLMLAGAGVPAGRTCSTNVNLVDLYPTFLDALGIAPVAHELGLPGQSLLGVAARPDDPSRVGFSEYHAIGSPSAAFMLTRGRFKFHHYVGHEPELFDLESDPEEARDLAASPDHAHVVAEFDALLRDRLDPAAVDRRAKDDQNALVAVHGGAEKAFRTGLRGGTPVPDSGPQRGS